MAVNYDKLWRILNERGMMKTELIREAKISTNAMATILKLNIYIFQKQYIPRSMRLGRTVICGRMFCI